MLVGQSGTTSTSGRIGWTIAQLKHDGTWLGNAMLPCRYRTPRSRAASNSAWFKASSPKSVGGSVSSSGSGW
jgi:hypothetical protein